MEEGWDAIYHLSSSLVLIASISPEALTFPWHQHRALEIELSDRVRCYGKTQMDFLANTMWFSALWNMGIFLGFWRQEYWSGLPFPPLGDYVLSKLFTMTRQSWWPCTTWLIASLSYASPSPGQGCDPWSGDSEGQRTLLCCNPGVAKNWTQLSNSKLE